MSAARARKRVRRLVDDHGVKMSKYLVGSVAAFLVSAVTYLATFGPGLLGSKSASLASSATGAVTNYVLNRYWTWRRRGRADFRREVVPYWTTVVVTAVSAAVVTGSVNAWLRHEEVARSTRTWVNTVAFVGTYGVAFLFKYRRFDQIFAKLHLPHHHHDARHEAARGGSHEAATEGQPTSRVSSTARD